jgi:hypothetical protein
MNEIAFGLDALYVQQTNSGLLGKKTNGSANEACFATYDSLKNKFLHYIIKAQSP